MTQVNRIPYNQIPQEWAFHERIGPFIREQLDITRQLRDKIGGDDDLVIQPGDLGDISADDIDQGREQRFKIVGCPVYTYSGDDVTKVEVYDIDGFVYDEIGFVVTDGTKVSETDFTYSGDDLTQSVKTDIANSQTTTRDYVYNGDDLAAVIVTVT